MKGSYQQLQEIILIRVELRKTDNVLAVFSAQTQARLAIFGRCRRRLG